MHLARPKATWALTLPLMFFASCMDAGPTEPPSAGELYGASEVGDAFDRFFLNRIHLGSSMDWSHSRVFLQALRSGSA